MTWNLMGLLVSNGVDSTCNIFVLVWAFSLSLKSLKVGLKRNNNWSWVKIVLLSINLKTTAIHNFSYIKVTYLSNY